ncbi:hypothetical protein L1987_11373 [Smallanthus sonchifolius]|uniref:Uncharacterized protein n=1 Tax=Smallanthus sonchifolius TaxID=185202 RepID=A0ACB9JD07_9ASTR|nr:hypothetical protein L1987_11373 [Smallanthus sonchifolius]
MILFLLKNAWGLHKIAGKERADSDASPASLSGGHGFCSTPFQSVMTNRPEQTQNRHRSLKSVPFRRWYR